MQTEPWELGLEIARPYSSKSRGNLVRQIKYKSFLNDILTNTIPIGGQDAWIVIIGRGRSLHSHDVAVSFHGRVIGNYIFVKLNSIIKIVRLLRWFFCADSGWFGKVGVKTFRENGDLKQEHYPPGDLP